MKPMSPRAKSLLAQYRRDEALPPAVRAHALHAIERRARTEQAAPHAEPAPSTPRLPWLSTPRWLALSGVLAAAVSWAALSRLGSNGTAPSVPRQVAAPFVGQLAAGAPEPALRAREPAATEAPSAPSEPAAIEPAQQTPLPASAPARVQDPPRASLDAHRSERWAARNPGRTARPEPAQQAELSSGPAPLPSPAAIPAPLSATSASEAPRTSTVLLPPSALRAREPESSASTLDAEVMQLREAHDRLRAGEPLRALSVLEEHARRFPDGELVALRKVARMQALCDLGQAERARAEAETFLRSYRESPYAQRVRHICDGRRAAPRKFE